MDDVGCHGPLRRRASRLAKPDGRGIYWKMLVQLDLEGWHDRVTEMGGVRSSRVVFTWMWRCPGCGDVWSDRYESSVDFLWEPIRQPSMLTGMKIMRQCAVESIDRHLAECGNGEA